MRSGVMRQYDCRVSTPLMNGMDELSAFVKRLAEEELRALVNHSPSAADKDCAFPGQEVYRELIVLCADELARRWRASWLGQGRRDGNNPVK